MNTRAIILTLCGLRLVAMGQEVDVTAAGAASEAAAAAVTPCEPVANGLVSWWRAEGDALDSWGTNHGSATAKFEAGKVGQCFTAASETRIAHSASLQLTNALTIEAWVNPQPNPQGVTYRSVVSKFAFSQYTSLRSGSYFFGLGYGNYPNGPVFMLTPSGFESNAVRLAPFTNLPSGQWSHLAATYDGAVMKLYLNGSLLGQSNYSGGIWPGTNDLGIGSTPVPGVARSSHRANARIDEPSIYRRALSAAEIAAIYAAGSSGKCVGSCVPSPEGLISWWPGDSNAVDVLGANSLVGVPQFAAGRVGQAFRFNASQPTLYVPVAPTLNFGSNVDFSMEMWIKVNSNLTVLKMPLMEKRYEVAIPENPAGLAGYSLSLESGKLAFWFSSVSSPNYGGPMISRSADLRDGQFHHVGVSVDRDATNGGRLYVDGQVVLMFNPFTYVGSLSNSSPFYLARRTSLGSGGYFDGLIDEPAIYKRALGDDEMRAIFAAGAVGKCKTPPIIITPPANARVAIGSNVTFTVTASGTPVLRYRWFRNGAPVNATNASFTFTASGPATVSVLVSNYFGAVTSSVATLTLNSRPVVTSMGVAVTEDTPRTITLSATDADGDALSFAIVKAPAFGTLSAITNSPAPGTLIYTPNTNFNGNDSFTFKANDGLQDSFAGTVSITVTPVNDPPVPVVRVFTRFLLSSNDAALRVIAGEGRLARVTFDASLTRDVENDPLTFAWKKSVATTAFATGVVATSSLSVGEHTLQLLVSDGTVTVTNSFALEVITGAEAVESLANLVADSGLPQGKRQPLCAMLRRAAHAFDTEHVSSGIHHLEMIQDHIRRWIAPDDAELAAQWIWIAQEIIDAFRVTEVVDARAFRVEAREHGHRALHFKGAQGRPYLVEASGDLANWQVLGAAVEGAPGEFEFDDPAGSTAPQRFYRIRKP